MMQVERKDYVTIREERGEREAEAYEAMTEQVEQELDDNPALDFPSVHAEVMRRLTFHLNDD